MVTAEKSRIDCRHIDVLDGIRAVSVIIVLIFHFWQQTWIFPVIKTPWLASVGITKIDFSNFATVGYLFVDMMVLISGFLLFLPLMRSIILGEEMSSWKNYARRRIARIVPSYYFAVLLLFFASALPTGAYATTADALKDLFAHLTFTQTLWVNTYIATPLDVVLWTVAIEVWFYVLFPFVAEFIKGPRNKNRQSFTPAYGIFFIFAVFNIINYVYTENFVLKGNVYLAMRINQFPAFLGVYSIGMLGASAFVLIAKNCRRSRIFNAVNTLFSVCSILLIIYLINDCVATQERQGLAGHGAFKACLCVHDIYYHHCTVKQMVSLAVLKQVHAFSFRNILQFVYLASMACRSVQKHLAHPEMVGRNSSEHAEYHLLDEQICCCNNSVRICGSNTCNLFN